MITPDINTISQNVKERGYYKVPNFLHQNHINTVEKILNIELGSNDRTVFPTKKTQYFNKLIKFEFTKLVRTRSLIEIANRLKLKSIAETILGNTANLYMMDAYRSKKAGEMIIPWHNDIGLKNNDEVSKTAFFESAKSTINNERNKSSARGVKIFIYLTDTESNNGSLGVIPYSQHVVKSLTKLILEKKVKLDLFWSLKDLREIVLKESIRPLLERLVGEEVLNKFLKSSEFINHSKDTFEFDASMKKGGAVIFDELSVHRGSKPTRNDRVVLRYLFNKKSK